MCENDPTLPETSPPSPRPPPPELRGLDARALLAGALRQEPRHDARWQPPPAETLAELLPQFRIECLIGRGGMGAVYRGVQESLHRPVAIKLLPEEMAADAAFVARFRREARTLAKLQHPGILAIYGFGQTSVGHLYIVMEFVDGADLAHIIRSAPLNVAQAMELMVQICEALQYAHSQGVIHRDIKPANILITKAGRAKLADFGLARPMNEDHGALTLTGTIMGTPAYMAPEQREGCPDHRSDIYALGVLFYEMLSGHRPEGVFDRLSARSGTDPRLDTVVWKAMQHDAERRFQAVGEIKAEIERIRTTPNVPSVNEANPPVEPHRKARSVSFGWAAIVLVLVGIFGVAFSLWKGGANVQPIGGATPGAATASQPFVNSLGMKFVPVPGTGVLMCVHETRKADYAAFAQAHSGVDGRWRNVTHQRVPVSDRDDHPVVNVNWADAQAFCAWLSAKEGRTYRLPTDREWSFAVGIADAETADATPGSLNEKIRDRYPWGDTWPPADGTGNFADATALEKFPTHGVIKDYSDGYATTAPVMSFPANKLGIFDLSGNVLEWCEDWYDTKQQARVMRGGAWFGYGNTYLLSSYRYREYPPSTRHMEIGFRCVLEPSKSGDGQLASQTPAN